MLITSIDLDYPIGDADSCYDFPSASTWTLEEVPIYENDLNHRRFSSHKMILPYNVKMGVSTNKSIPSDG